MNPTPTSIGLPQKVSVNDYPSKPSIPVSAYEEVVEVSGQSKDFTNSVAFVEVKFLSASTKDFFTSK